jgi:hypothetical protein
MLEMMQAGRDYIVKLARRFGVKCERPAVGNGDTYHRPPKTYGCAESLEDQIERKRADARLPRR